MNPNINDRTDTYGGSIENRARLTIEILEKISDAIGTDKVGLRISPFLNSNDMPAYDPAEVLATYVYLAQATEKLGIAYLHISDNPNIPAETHQAIRSNYSNAIIYCNGLTAESAEEKLQHGVADLVAFGRSFLSNPDFVKRMEKNAPLNELDYNTLYTPGKQGYTDYPELN